MNKDNLLVHFVGDLVLDYDSRGYPMLGYVVGFFDGRFGTYYEVQWMNNEGYMYYGSSEIISMKGKLLKFKQEKSIE